MINQELLMGLVIVISIGAVSGFLGTLMLTKKMTLVGGPLGHLTLPGIAIALLLGFDVFFGAVAFVMLGILVIWIFEKLTRLPVETLTAIVFPFAMATSFLFLTEDETTQALIGDISQINLAITLGTAALSILVFLTIRYVYRKLVFIGVSADLAKVEGLNADRLNLIFLVCTALVIALSVRVVGGLMTVALMAIPASTSRNLSNNLTFYSWGGVLFGVLASMLGYLWYSFFAIPIGPAIIIVSVVLFLVSLLYKILVNK